MYSLQSCDSDFGENSLVLYGIPVILYWVTIMLFFSLVHLFTHILK